ncbi:hypothetical protein OsccyDRAFT_1548 [Leptolyngbyaceae cyanobacterium JSC-12]|nr:hypothetical protein OsccyDRAFT_1548 [Leptolyngbyaceae cyanobacterium JSC-12]
MNWRTNVTAEYYLNVLSLGRTFESVRNVAYSDGSIDSLSSYASNCGFRSELTPWRPLMTFD